METRERNFFKTCQLDTIFKYTKIHLGKRYTEQILGNNDFFDDDFYYNLGINLDEVCYFDFEIKNFAEFMLEWHNYFERHPEKKGLPDLSEHIVERFANKSSDQWKAFVYAHYASAESYEMQLYNTARDMYKYLDFDGNVLDKYTIQLISR